MAFRLVCRSNRRTSGVDTGNPIPGAPRTACIHRKSQWSRDIATNEPQLRERFFWANLLACCLARHHERRESCFYMVSVLHELPTERGVCPAGWIESAFDAWAPQPHVNTYEPSELFLTDLPDFPPACRRHGSCALASQRAGFVSVNTQCGNRRQQHRGGTEDQG